MYAYKFYLYVSSYLLCLTLFAEFDIGNRFRFLPTTLTPDSIAAFLLVLIGDITFNALTYTVLFYAFGAKLG